MNVRYFQKYIRRNFAVIAMFETGEEFETCITLVQGKTSKMKRNKDMLIQMAFEIKRGEVERSYPKLLDAVDEYLFEIEQKQVA